VVWHFQICLWQHIKIATEPVRTVIFSVHTCIRNITWGYSFVKEKMTLAIFCFVVFQPFDSLMTYRYLSVYESNSFHENCL
jgi:hypothetical protein